MSSAPTPLFSESQTFSPVLVRLVFFSFALLFAYGVIQQEFFHAPFGDKPAPTGVLIMLCLMLIGLGSFFSATRLQTEITEEGIRYRFSPIQRNFTFIAFHEMRTLCVRTYRPIAEYGGWGYRTGFWRRGNALSIWGTSGIQIVRTSGAALLLGTRKEKEVIEVLEKLGHIKVSPKDSYVPMAIPQ
jgi:hypothetical protein